MSDQSSPPPPKPKPGSLRDRIAAFEKSSTAAAPPPPGPAVRPKPAGFSSWKPKAPSPPSSPPASSEHGPSTVRTGGMSASDAKESITKGGSLKDRMAALQGKGAFGAPAPPTAPKPAIEKPKWKPPPVVHAPIDDGDQAVEDKPAAASLTTALERTLSPPISVKSRDGDEPAVPVAHGEDSAGHEGDDDSAVVAEQDPEEEERQRRAAIAARMARLGGARVGMAPPVFGKKPPMPVRKPTQEEIPKAEEVKPAEIPLPTSPEPLKPSEEPTNFAVAPISPPSEAQPVEKAESEITTSPEQVPTGKSSESVSILSDESSTHVAKNPLSMPVPAVPRRAGPPRKKPAKPSATPPETPEAKIEAAEEQPAVPVTHTDIDASQIPVPGAESVPLVTSEEVKDHGEDGVRANDATPKPSHDDESKAQETQDEKVFTEATSVLPSSLSGSVSSVLDDEVIQSPPPSLAISPSTKFSPEIKVNASTLDVAITQLDPSPSSSPSPPLLPTVNSGEEFAVDLDQVELDEEVEVEERDDVDIITETATPHPPAVFSAQEEPEVDAVTDGQATEPPQHEDHEEEEAARKKRVAERIAKMGGVNPFAPPPPRSPPQAQTSPEVVQSPEAILAPVETVTLADEDDILASSDRLSKIDVPLVEKEEGSHAIRVSTDKEGQHISSDEDDQFEDEVYDDGVPPGSKEEEDQQYGQESSKAGQLSETSATLARPPPPLPPLGTRPSVQGHQYGQEPEVDDLAYEQDDEVSDYGDDTELTAHDNTSHLVSPAVASTQGAGNIFSLPSPPRPAQPPRRLIPQTPQRAQSDDEEQETERIAEEEEQETDEEADERMATSHLFIPPPGGRGPITIQPSGIRRSISQDDEDGDGSENDSPALPVPPTRRSVDAPPAGRSVSRDYENDDDRDSENESDHDGQALPIPLRARDLSSSSGGISQPAQQGSPPAPRGPPPSIPLPGMLSQTRPAAPASPELLAPSVSVSGSEEILDEEEGDPIDPFFHSPSRQASSTNLRGAAQAGTAAQEQLATAVASSLAPSPPVSQQPEEPEAEEEEQEQLRRKTIAERMAKLGGIRFGAAPLPTPSRVPPAPRHEEEEQEEARVEENQEEEPILSEEEEERARKERIAAKMAQMGGLRIGMMPMGMGLPPPPRSHALKEEKAEKAPSPPLPPPPARAVPPTRPPPPSVPAPPPPAPAQQTHDTDSEYTASEDGVKVEAEESELEEVGFDDVEEETPPPVPSRSGRGAHRQDSSDKTVSPPRPPVPVAVPIRRSSVQTNKSTGSSSGISPPPPQRKSSSFMPQSEYVMVEEPESQEIPTPPPARPVSRLPPARSTPQIPQPSRMTSDPTDISSQWELPSIPNASLDMDGGNDLSMSWTDAAEPSSLTTSLHSQPPAPPAPNRGSVLLPMERQLSADDLMALWGRVGVQVCEVATSMFEKSKKTLVGDGTYSGFIQSVLAAVPNAAPAPTAAGEYGYLIYVQNGPSVQKRVSDIMPGDIVEIVDAKLKGHKGLQTYHQSVGVAGSEPLVGVVGEFEPKKSKIRVFHANQHVGQQSVESVSYRLEDVKSGLIKVYRVHDA